MLQRMTRTLDPQNVEGCPLKVSRQGLRFNSPLSPPLSITSGPGDTWQVDRTLALHLESDLVGSLMP